jgi:hypothetical protein
MGLQHFNYFWWDSEGRRIIFRGTFGIFFFYEVSREGRERGLEEFILHRWTSG